MVDAVLKCSSKKHDNGGGYGADLEGYAEAFIGSARYGCVPFNNIEDVSDAAWHLGMFLHCLAENPFNPAGFKLQKILETEYVYATGENSEDYIKSLTYDTYTGNLVTIYNAWKNAMLNSDRVETNGVLNTSFDNMVQSYYDNVKSNVYGLKRLLTIPQRYLSGAYSLDKTLPNISAKNPPVRTAYTLDTLGVGLTQTPRITISGCTIRNNLTGDSKGNLPAYTAACGTNNSSYIDRYYGPMNPFKADIWHD